MTAVHEASFGPLLKRHRLTAGLSQEALAERAGLSARAISDLERGARRTPHPETVTLLADALGLSAEDRAAFVAPILHRRLRAARPPAAIEAGLAAPPAPLTPLLGREREEAVVTSLLRPAAHGGPRLVTLTGPGGVGKTRLALQVAATLRPNFPDGVAFVDLAPLRDPRLALPAIARGVGLRDTGDRPVGERLAAHLRGRRLLLVLDNVEPVVEAAPEVATLLGDCPALAVLATSRIALRVRGEQEFLVSPLATPDPARGADPSALAMAPSVALFVDRARAMVPEFALTAANGPAVAAVCRRLDGLPLAIELAAAWARVLPPEALLTRLERALPVLVDGPRDLPERQRTLRRTIDWSYARLTPGEQRLFRRLASFVGGCTAAAAVAVAGDDEPTALAGLAALVEKHLLRRLPAGQGDAATPYGARHEPRFAMLETIREYAWERLVRESGPADLPVGDLPRGEESAIRRRHAAWCLALVEEIEPHLKGGGRAPWLDRLEAEHANVRAALQWCLLDAGDRTTGLRIVGALGWFWYFRGYQSEGRGWAAAALAGPADDQPAVPRARALYTAALLAFADGEFARGLSPAEESAALFAAAGDRRGHTLALAKIALLRSALGDAGGALALLGRSVALLRELGEAWVLATTLAMASEAAWRAGDPEAAHAQLDEALALFAAWNDRWGQVVAHFFLGGLAEAEGDDDTAAAHYAESAARARALDYKHGLAFATLRQGCARLRRGDLPGARVSFAEGLVAARDLGLTAFILLGLAGCAALAAAAGRDVAAVQLLGRVGPLGDDGAAPVDSMTAAAREACGPHLAALQARVEPVRFAAAYAAARALPLDEAIALGLSLVAPADDEVGVRVRHLADAL